jgi:hypothetical protein
MTSLRILNTSTLLQELLIIFDDFLPLKLPRERHSFLEEKAERTSSLPSFFHPHMYGIGLATEHF